MLNAHVHRCYISAASCMRRNIANWMGVSITSIQSVCVELVWCGFWVIGIFVLYGIHKKSLRSRKGRKEKPYVWIIRNFIHYHAEKVLKFIVICLWKFFCNLSRRLFFASMPIFSFSHEQKHASYTIIWSAFWSK